MDIDHLDVPAPLRDLIPMAERWGIGDDVDRYNTVEDASPVGRLELGSAMRLRIARLVDEWLGGDEAAGPTWTDAYVAFSNLQLAIDEALAIDRTEF